jgi:hypothetical protein
MDPLGGVVITSREIYDAVVRLTGRVDVLIAQSEEVRHDLQDHETRLRALERARWPLPAASVLIALAAFGWSVLGG